MAFRAFSSLALLALALGASGDQTVAQVEVDFHAGTQSSKKARKPDKIHNVMMRAERNGAGALVDLQPIPFPTTAKTCDGTVLACPENPADDPCGTADSCVRSGTYHSCGGTFKKCAPDATGACKTAEVCYMPCTGQFIKTVTMLDGPPKDKPYCTDLSPTDSCQQTYVKDASQDAATWMGYECKLANHAQCVAHKLCAVQDPQKTFPLGATDEAKELEPYDVYADEITECTNHKKHAQDTNLDSCDKYALLDFPLTECGNHDDNDFSSNTMCCSCKIAVAK